MNRLSKNFWLAWLIAFVALGLATAPLALKANEDIKDPVCGMKVDQAKAQQKSEYQGTTYYFCSEGCKNKFDANPAQFVKKGEKPGCPGMAMMHQEKNERGEKSCCEGMMKDVKLEVMSLPNGVQVKITSGKPEVVKVIQEMHQEGKGMGCSMMMKNRGVDCPMRKTSKSN